MVKIRKSPKFSTNEYPRVCISKTIRDTLKAIYLTKKAFQLRKVKHETLAYAFQQIKPILKEYMKENNIQLIKVNLKTKKALVIEPIPNVIKQAWVEQWLNGELSTEQFNQWLGCRYQNSHYLSFADFLEGVESWLRR